MSEFTCPACSKVLKNQTGLSLHQSRWCKSITDSTTQLLEERRRKAEAEAAREAQEQAQVEQARQAEESLRREQELEARQALVSGIVT